MRRLYLLRKPLLLSLAMLAAPCLILFVSNERHLQLVSKETTRREDRLAVPTDMNFTAIEIEFRKSQTELPLPNADKEWRCGYSQLHCNKTRNRAKYRKHMVRKTLARNEIQARVKAQSLCSCLSAMQGAYFCCQKAIIVVHKMGVTVVRDIKNAYFKKRLFTRVATPEIISDHTSGHLFKYEYQQPFTADYRHVVVSRNWYDSLISGYLYHKTGKECWLDWYGHSNHEGWLLNNTDENWERRLLQNASKPQGPSWRPGNGRDLCQYLTEESEEEGLRVYAAWAIASFLSPLLEFRQLRLDYERREKLNRTMFLCYEQLVNQETYSSTVFSIYRWLHPIQMPWFNVSSPNFTYYGGHASDQDPKLRIRLRKTLLRLDTEIFGGTIRQGSAAFGCGII